MSLAEQTRDRLSRIPRSVGPARYKHSVVVGGHKTSVTLEPEFWTALKQIAKDRKITISALMVEIDCGRAPDSNLSSACRVYLLRHFQRGAEGAQQ